MLETPSPARVVTSLRRVRSRTTTRPHRGPARSLTVGLVTALLVSTVPLTAQAGTRPAAGPAPATPATAAQPAHRSTGLDPDVDRMLGLEDGMLFGVSVSRRDHATTEDRLVELENQIDRRLDAHRWYARWDDEFPPKQVVDSVAQGRTPVLTIETRHDDGTKLSWAAIARGEHDREIVRHARGVKSLGVPVAMSFQHEPEFADGHGTPAEYRAAWRHYVDVFRAQGVDQVLWTWIVTPTVFLENPPTPSADELYPGDDVVDWLGLDAYNWYGCMDNGQDTWRPMTQIAQTFRDFGAAHRKPLMLAEWGSVEDPADPNRKAAWLHESMSALLSWPEMKAILYFDHHGNCPWWIDSSPQSAAMFKEIANWRSAHGRTQAWLRAPETVGAAPYTVTFDGSRSTASGRATGWGIQSWRLDLGDGTVRTGTGRPPSDLRHTYAAGTHTARLTVRDSAGRTATDHLELVAADTPEVSGAGRELHPTSGTLVAWVDGHGLPGTVEMEWGTSTAYGSSTTLELPAVPYMKTLRAPMTGLEPGQRYDLRITATTAAGTEVYTSRFWTPARS